MAGTVVRKTRVVSGNRGYVGNNGLVPGRRISIIKQRQASDLRISYTDNFGVFYQANTVTACQWDIKINDPSCPSGALTYSQLKFSSKTIVDLLQFSTVVGYCSSLPARLQTVTVYVKAKDSSPTSRCYTGWNSRFMLEVEEVN